MPRNTQSLLRLAPQANASSPTLLRRRWTLMALLGVVLPTVLPSLSGNRAEAQAASAPSGYELLLDERPRAILGGQLHISGTAFQVRGYAELTPLRNDSVTLRVQEWPPDEIDARGRRRRPPSQRVVLTERVQTDGQGHFHFTVRIPEALHRPSVRLSVGSRRGRDFDFPLVIGGARRFDLLTDRVRYQPGETVHVWARLHRTDDGRPLSGQPVRVTVQTRGSTIAEEEVRTADSGALHVPVTLSEDALDGSYQVIVQSIDGNTVQGSRTFTVGRRTVERLMATLTLDQPMVRPSERLTGRVTVRTPSGTPVRGAEVQLEITPGTTISVTTGRDGSAVVRAQAPPYLAGDSERREITARANHPAHGSALASAAYVLARSPWRVALRAEGGGAVPQTAGRAFVIVTDPLGQPAPEGMSLLLRGPAIRGGQAQLRLDEHGMGEVAVQAEDGTSADAGACAGQHGTVIHAEIRGTRPLVTETCLTIASHAQLRVGADRVLATPGDPIRLTLNRHPAVRGREVLIEAMIRGRIVATVYSTRDQATVTVPADAAGVLTLRARPLLPIATATGAHDEAAVGIGTGSSTAVLVRPADAFSLSIESDTNRFLVRQHADLRLRRRGHHGGDAWAAYVVRDLAAHGGEQPWRTDWIRSAIGDALSVGLSGDGTESGRTRLTEAEERLLGAALHAALSPDQPPVQGPPLVPHPWYPGSVGGRQAARDPIAMRDQMRLRQVGRLMLQIEQATTGALANDALRQQLIDGRRFQPNVIAKMEELRLLSRGQTRTLGGEQATLAMLQALQPGFDFDMVARRIARAQLGRLMAAVVAFTDPDNPNAAREASGYGPTDWLSRMVQIGTVRRQDIMDPWGHPFAMRTTARPLFVLSTVAPRHELVSAGPDGRFGTADDLRDPFARVIPEKTPYAVAGGEDRLMAQLAMLAPGPATLSAMAAAYASMDLATLEEARASTVTAAISEGDDMFDYAPEAEEESFGLGGMALSGVGRGGGGMAVGTAAPRVQAARHARESPAAEPMDASLDGLSERSAQNGADAVFDTMARVVRERFPATLQFMPEVGLDGGATPIEIPLADALTTYRIEAIAWSRSGWVTTATHEIRVDQDATIDAPVPTFATEGDLLRLPVRVTNRTDSPLDAVVRVFAEEIEVTLPGPKEIQVGAQDGRETIVEIRLPQVGSGHLRLEVTRPDGTRLDAIRRPIHVWESARLVEISRTLLTEPGNAMEITVPSDARGRGPARLRVSPADHLFGNPATIGATDPRAIWLLALRGQPITEDQRRITRQVLGVTRPGPRHRLGDVDSVAHALAVAWDDPQVSDEIIARALRHMPTSESTERHASEMARAARMLIALAPAARSERRSELHARRDELLDGWVESASSAVREERNPTLWSECAFALALHEETGRARELIRRTERHLVAVGDLAFVIAPDAPATARLASAYATLGRRDDAMPLLRALAGASTDPSSDASGWGLPNRMVAVTAAALVAGQRPSQITLTVDGETVALEENGEGLFAGVSDALAQPGEHRIRVQAGDAPALLFVDLAYGRPWDVPPARSLRVELTLDGELGARDTRAGLALRVQNREPRLIGAPVVLVDLPSGSEFEEDARARLRALTVGEPVVEGHVLRLRLRPLMPGSSRTIPLPIRWTTGGTLRGLGVTLHDESDALRATAVIPARSITIEDAGAAPELPDAEEHTPPPPPPPPPPIEPFERLSPVARVTPTSPRFIAVEGALV